VFVSLTSSHTSRSLGVAPVTCCFRPVSVTFPRGWFRPASLAPWVFVTDAHRHRPDVVPPLMCGQRSARSPVTSTTHQQPHRHHTDTAPSPAT
jgi:hypothetical protein